MAASVAVTGQPLGRYALGRILDQLGSTIIGLLVGDTEGRIVSGDVVIYDPLDELPHPGSLILAVGVAGPQQILTMLHRLRESAPTAVIVRAPVEVNASLRAAVADDRLALLSVSRGVSWAQLAVMLRTILTESALSEDALEAPELAAGDLFAVANAVSGLIDAPLTIEDRSSRVLAFSQRQDEADEPRIAAVLGRHIPERYGRLLRESGVFDRLYRSREPVFLDVRDVEALGITKSRTALAIRAGGEVLGSIWAASDGPLAEEQIRAFTGSADLVALAMLRHRAGADQERRLRSGLLTTLLGGEGDTGDAMERLGLVGRTMIVFAVAAIDDGSEAAADLEEDRRRLADSFLLHLQAHQSRSAAALIGGRVYGIMPGSEGSVAQAYRAGDEFVTRNLARGLRLVVAAGRRVFGDEEVSTSRDDADRVLRVLLEEGSPRVGLIEQEANAVLLAELRSLVRKRGYASFDVLTRLRAYDQEHGGDLLSSLRVWLDALGDVGSASARLHVHPNTFRYRLKRIAEVGGLDLADPELRFAVQLQFRLDGA